MLRLPRLYLLLPVFGLFSLSFAPKPAAAIDLGGVYISQVNVLFTPCTLTFVQTGSALTIDGPCIFGSTTYTFDLEGTVDPMTGAFSVTGELLGLCEDPNEVTMTGTGDGETFTALSACGTLSSTVTGTKCGNGTIDPTEDCEDGNTANGDCCSSVCLFESAGTACAADSLVCTLDECDGAGQCSHPPAPAGTPCTSDSNPCTDDVCNGAALCSHPPASGTCDDFNACTDPDACSGGLCTGPIVPECVGPLDLTGTWLLDVGTGFFSGNPIREFVQTGALLLSSTPGGATGPPGMVNPATGTFQSNTPVFIFIANCLEIVVGTASSDGQTFEGQRGLFCGVDGNHGPFSVSGLRCPPSGCPTFTPTPTRTPTPTLTASPTAPPNPGCIPEGPCSPPDTGSRLVVRAYNSRGTTRWRWDHSPMTADFGDPTAATVYHFCLETPGGQQVEMLPAGSGWNATGSGFNYTASTGSVRRVVLKSTARKTSINLSLKPVSPLPLPLATPVTFRVIQRTGSSSACFEAVYQNPDVSSDSAFRASQ